MAVLYLDSGEADEALRCAGKSYEMAKDVGGIALAEPGRNLARGWLAKGNPEKAQPYIREAYPILAEAYGPDHPKVKWCEEHLETKQ